MNTKKKLPNEQFRKLVEFINQSREDKTKKIYVDCIGYILAKNMGFKFLTGEDFFDTTENVEFVK